MDNPARVEFLGWTLLVLAAVGFLLVINKWWAGKPLSQRRRDGTVHTMSVGTAAAGLSVVAAVAALFVYHGRSGGGVPRWLLVMSLGVLVLATLGLPLVDEFRNRNR